MLRLILKYNSFSILRKELSPNSRNRNWHKYALTSAVETEIIGLCNTKPLEWKRCIDDILSLWNVDKKKIIEEFIVLANKHHPTVKFTVEISDKEIDVLDTTVFKGERFNKKVILDICTHFKLTETFQYTEFSSFHPPG